MTDETIFATALEKVDPVARAAFLAEACGGDPDRRKRVERLLAAHSAAAGFLERPPVPTDPENMPTRDFSGPDTDPDEPDDALAFLAPPGRPDSLGRIGHYEVLQVLGKGGFGIVFRAFDDQLQRVVAVKVMAPPMAATSPARKRFLREARTSAQVRHENVVQVYEVAESPLPYLVMEFIPGETLQQRLDRTGPLDAVEVVRIGRQIAEGLAAAHATDLIHRDIKPGNVLIEGGQQKVKITDFGLARAADDASLSQSGIIAGTPMYMAPEQAKGDHLDQRADLFSLGSVLYQMAAGRPPFRANNTIAVLKRVAEDTPRPIREIIPETPQWLCDIIAKLHAKNPDDRYQSAREVADVLADCEAQLKAGSKLKDFSRIPKGEPAARETPAARSMRWVAVAGLTVFSVCGLVAVVAGLFFRTHEPKPNEVPVTTAGDPTPAAVAKPEPAAPLASPGPLPPTFKNGIGMEFVLVPKGKSWLGGGGGRPGEQEEVIPADFYLGKYEVTQEEWEKVTGENPSRFSRAGASKDAVKDVPDPDLKRFPVESVSWDQCQVFVAKLNQREKETGWVYRLPSEAEWEYACRGGPMADRADSAFDFYFARPTNVLLPEQANFESGKGLKRTCKVGLYEPNSLGLYDMHGNVWEWCDDTVEGANRASLRVNRGGGWNCEPESCRAARRPPFGGASPPSYRHSVLGFRVARVPAATEPKPADPTFFSGKDLTGWVGDTGNFAAANQALLGSLRGPANKTVYRDKAYRDFEVSFQAKFKGGTGSLALSFRSAGEVRGESAKLTGPLVHFSAAAWGKIEVPGKGAGGRFTLAEGTLTGVVNDDFNDVRIRCVGKKVTVHINDAVAAEVEHEGVPDEGVIGLRLGSGTSQLTLQNLRLVDLGPRPPAPPAEGESDRTAADSVLSLGGTVRAEGDEREIKAAADLPKGAFRLTWAGFSNSKTVTDAGLAAFKDCKKLSALDLAFTEVGDAGLAHLADCQGLTSLDLRFTKVTDAGLANAKAWKDLTYFNLTACEEVTDAGLAHLQGCKKLESIALDGTKVTDAGLAHLKGCGNLKELQLPTLPITDAGLTHLAGLNQLTELNLTKTQVTAKGVEGLAKALPKCKITWDGGTIEPK